MEFTYEAYENLINTLKQSDYEVSTYENINKNKKSVILRHDVDFDLESAVEMAELENSMGVISTYFILLSTDFYNVFSKSSFEKISKIESLNHRIGLHFDEQRYEINSTKDLKKYVKFEAGVISELLGYSINVVSMHRPSQVTLDMDIDFDGLINSYSSEYFSKMKYVSDSRMNWRENIMDIINSDEYKKLHILTHPFWYSNKVENQRAKILNFIKKSKFERYEIISQNFRNIEEFIKAEDLI